MEIQINKVNNYQKINVFDSEIDNIDFTITQIVYTNKNNINISRKKLISSISNCDLLDKKISINLTNIDHYDGYLVYLLLVELVNKKVEIINIMGDNVILLEAKRLITNYMFANKLMFLPPNILTPKYYEKIIFEYFKDYDINIKSYSSDEIKNKFHGLEAVSRGSNYPPKLIHIKYCINDDDPIVLVAKGVTFDAGGFNLKKGNMHMSKLDMSGSAHALITFMNLIQSNYQSNIELILLICENQISSKMMLPGEIIHYQNNISVEVTNCDAEGRLILADGLLLAQRSLPKYIIDIATLTGSAGACFGNEITPIMGTLEVINAVINEEYEQCYVDVPLLNNYLKRYKSLVADIVNHVEGDAGCLMAGLFLQHFVGNNDWLHFDIAATALAPNKERANEKLFIDLSKMINLLGEE